MKLLLLHGFLSGSGAWAPLRRELAGSVSTLAPDLAGYGGARAAGGTYDLEALVEHLTPVIERERPTHVVGHSMGGLVALALARRYPGTFAGVGLVGLPVYHGREDGLAYLRRRPTTRLMLQDDRAGHLACTAAHRLRAAWVPAVARLTRRPREVLAAMFDHSYESHTGGLDRIVFAGLADKLAADADLAVAALHGGRDRSAPLSRVSDVARRHGWSLSVAPRAGHQVIFEQPALTARWIREHVLSLSGAKAEALA